MEHLKSIRHTYLSGVSLVMIAVGVTINLVMGEITALLKIPLYLDSIGTILVAATCGALSSLLTGIISNLLGSALIGPATIFFMPVSLVIAIFSSFAASIGGFSRLWKTVLLGICQGLVAALIATPIAAYVFGGITLAGTDIIVFLFRAYGNSITSSVLYQSLLVDPIDKTISFLLVYSLLRKMPATMRNRLPRFTDHPS